MDTDAQLRENLRNTTQTQETLDRVRGEVKRLARLATTYADKLKAADEAEYEMLQVFGNFSFLPDEQDPFLVQSVRTLQTINQNRTILIETVLVKQLNRFLDGETEGLQHLETLMEASSVKFNDLHRKIMHLKAADKGKEQAKLAKLEDELTVAATAFAEHSRTFASKLNQIETSARSQITESLIACIPNPFVIHMYSHLNFLNKSSTVAKTFEPHLAAATNELEIVRAKSRAGAATLRSSAEAHGEPGLTKQGYLLKRAKGLKGWDIRWFVLDGNGTLRWYRSWKKLTARKGKEMRVVLCTIKPVPPDQSKYPFTFDIVSPSLSLQVRALSNRDMVEWMSTFQRAVSAKLATREQGVPTYLLEIRAQDPGNSECADCGRKDPEWASINLGIICCIECSGVHRSLGSHISKIRSLALDKWEPEVLFIMQQLGNTRANSFWEAELLEESRKPTPEADRAAKETFIAAKYKDKKYMLLTLATPEAVTKSLVNAARKDDIYSCAIAIGLGADVLYKDETGTPLTCTLARDGKHNALEFLLQNGGDPLQKDNEGLDALAVSLQAMQPACCRLLLSRFPGEVLQTGRYLELAADDADLFQLIHSQLVKRDKSSSNENRNGKVDGRDTISKRENIFSKSLNYFRSGGSSVEPSSKSPGRDRPSGGTIRIRTHPEEPERPITLNLPQAKHRPESPSSPPSPRAQVSGAPPVPSSESKPKVKPRRTPRSRTIQNLFTSSTPASEQPTRQAKPRAESPPSAPNSTRQADQPPSAPNSTRQPSSAPTSSRQADQPPSAPNSARFTPSAPTSARIRAENAGDQPPLASTSTRRAEQPRETPSPRALIKHTSFLIVPSPPTHQAEDEVALSPPSILIEGQPALPPLPESSSAPPPLPPGSPRIDQM